MDSHNQIDPHPADLQTHSLSFTTTSAKESAVLENFDLLEIIFFFFEPESDVSSKTWSLSPEARQSLLNAALTCKVFVDPAMNALWRSMDSLAPLVKILPTFVRTGIDYTVNGAILDSHLHRVDHYARRIRRLRLDSLHETLHNFRRPVPSFIYQTLASLRPSGVIPALTHLSIPSLFPQSGIDLSALNILAVSSLLFLEIENIRLEVDDSVTFILNEYSVKAPAIKLITFSGGITHLTVDCLSNFDQLFDLTLNFGSYDALEPNILRKCSEIKSLSHLKLRLWIFTQPLSPSAESIQCVNFSTVLELEVSGATTNAVALLQSASLPRLRSVVFKLYCRHQGTSDLHTFAKFIQQLVDMGRIQSVTITLDLDEYNPRIGWEVFIPFVLHACNHIRFLDLLLLTSKGYCPFLDFCRTLQWPELQSLRLWCNGDLGDIVPSPSTEELFSLVCPKLKSFDIRMF